jgi:hypothetical protein
MLINERQLIMLLDIAKFVSTSPVPGVPYTQETLTQLINEIHNQQSQKLVQVQSNEDDGDTTEYNDSKKHEVN